MIEAETYMQEDNLYDDKLCKTLKGIGDIIAEEDNSTKTIRVSLKKNKFVRNTRRIVILYEDTLEIYNKKITEMVIKTTALFTDLSFINIYEYKGEGLIEKNKIYKETVVKKFNLDLNELEKNANEFIVKLKGKNAEI
ncbi:uncharacterized protein VNE69_09166 [Vairimorpha necatrix]|uniref:Uncharacterized protein n=1 Tax=Vairimorpha necatrix TaxID=6039 RepID=A0AAX4JF82_9MICR